jgi:ATP-dependent Lon protease
MVTNFDGNSIQVKSELPLLPIRDLVVYPFMILPLFVGRKSSVDAVEASLESFDRQIFLASQKKVQVENPTPEDIYNLGTVAVIMRMRKLSDGRLKILVQGVSKARVVHFEQNKSYFKVKLNEVTDTTSYKKSLELDSIMRECRENLEQIINLGKSLSPDILMVLEDIEDPGRLADLIASNLTLAVEDAQRILETIDPVQRILAVGDILKTELQTLAVQNKFKTPQSEKNLKEQISHIKKNLQESEPADEFEEYKLKIQSAHLSDEAEKEAAKQLARLEKMHPDSSEANIIRSYIECLLDIPWQTKSKEITDLNFAKEVLDEDHYQLEEAKDRILEHLAVRSLKSGSIKGPILCLAGPPGVGKTSLGKSIAKAMGREFVRISLGGVKDESEIRGHRRTYVGSMPGRFIQALKQAKTINPVIMLDEIDKMGADYKGDPSAAMLEVLDPEQNKEFRDHYVGIPVDLSQVLFIATANMLDQIPGPLRDRMEVLSLSGYSQEEKQQISNKYLIPKQIEENGLSPTNVIFTEEGVRAVIEGYTREAGLRNLERKIAGVCRKIARKVASGEKNLFTVTAPLVTELLGAPLYSKDDRKEYDEIGVATGLAWTASGGEVLYIEATTMKGKGITLTGQLGEVMKESAQAAMGFIRSNAEVLGIDERIFEEREIHIHLPAGAIPKDGPSAGITLATTIVSVLTKSMICKDIAMTGEITLTGKVLPIGGVKEKALAAMRMGIETVIIPWQNQKDLAEVPEAFRKKINFIPVKNIFEVLEIALVDWQKNKVKKPNEENNKQLAA